MNQKKQKAFFIFGGAVIVAFAMVLYFSRGENDQTSPTAAIAPTSTPAADVPKAQAYKDGTYAATGSYKSPAGIEKIGVSFTLKDGVVTDATVTAEAGDPRSMSFQQKFIDGYKQYVVGQKLDSIHFVDAVSGSSLTPQGFNDAVAEIKSEAVS